MKWITVLFFIGFIGYEIHGSGPPPPASRKYSDLFSVETSHETYRPSKKLVNSQQEQHASAATANNNRNNNNRIRNSFRDLLSSVSHESEQYSQSEYSDSNGSDIESNQKLVEIDNINESTLNTIKNFSPSISPFMLFSTLPWHEINTSESTKSPIQKSENDIITQSSNNLKSKCPSKISKYLSLGDKIVQIKTNFVKSSENDDDVGDDDSVNRKFRIDVTHDVFNTTESLVAGIIYKGEIRLFLPRHRPFHNSESLIRDIYVY